MVKYDNETDIIIVGSGLAEFCTWITSGTWRSGSSIVQL